MLKEGRETNSEVNVEGGVAFSGLLDKMVEFGSGSRGQGHHHPLGRETRTERKTREALRDPSAESMLLRYGYRVPRTLFGVGRLVRAPVEDWEDAEGSNDAYEGGTGGDGDADAAMHDVDPGAAASAVVRAVGGAERKSYIDIDALPGEGPAFYKRHE